jgi:hypothetical protein
MKEHATEEAIIYRIVEQWGNALCPMSEMVKWLKDYRATEDASPILDGPTKPDTCPYEQTVMDFFKLPEDVQEGTEIKADFGILVNLVCYFEEQAKRRGEWQEFLDHTDKELFQEESKRFQEEREILYSRLKAFDQLAHEQHTFLEEAAQFLPLDEYTRYKALSEKYAALCGRETGHISPHQNQTQ